jgi:hypothetical protein
VSYAVPARSREVAVVTAAFNFISELTAQWSLGHGITLITESFRLQFQCFMTNLLWKGRAKEKGGYPKEFWVLITSMILTMKHAPCISLRGTVIWSFIHIDWKDCEQIELSTHAPNVTPS